MKQLNRIVTMYLDYAEDQAERNQPMYMKDWVEKLNAFLQFNEREILENAGRVSKKVAEKLAIQVYQVFNRQRIHSNTNDDFENFIKKSGLEK